MTAPGTLRSLLTTTATILTSTALVLSGPSGAGETAGSTQPAKLLIEDRSLASDIHDAAERSNALEQILSAQVTINPSDARDTLKQFPQLPNRLNHFASLASIYAKAGNIDETERMYAEIRLEDRSSQRGKLAAADARGALAMAYANAGKMDNAFRIVGQIRDQFRENPPGIIGAALADFATSQAKQGDITGAVRTATGIASGNPQALIGIVAGRVRAGDLLGAQQIVAGLDEGLQRYAQWGIVQAQRDQGRLTEAQVTASAIKPGHAKASALRELASHHLKAGGKSNAVGLLQEAATAAGVTVNEWARADILWHIAATMAEAGETFAALETAKAIEKEGHRRFAILDIVKAQAKQGDFKGAFNNALLLKQDSTDDSGAASGYESAVAEILAELAKTGRTKEAREAVGNFEDLKHRRRILYGRIAWAQADAGDVQGAKATFALADSAQQRAARKKDLLRLSQISREHLSTDDQNRLQELHEMDGMMRWTLDALAKAQARKGDLRSAITTADEFSQPAYRFSLLQEIGTMQAQSGRTQQALAWARSLPSPSDKAYALLGIAQGLASAKTKLAAKKVAAP
jgi:hypothetical protein